MKKWLVGLLAASLCAASAWADSVTYKVTSKTAVEITEGEAPEGASAVYAQTANNMGQATKDNSMTLTLSGFEGATITGLTLSMKSNSKAGAGSLSVTCGDAVIASIPNAAFSDESWNGGWSTEYVDVTPDVTPTSVTGDVVITIAATTNSLYCQSFTIEYEPGGEPPPFSIKLDPAEAFEVVQGKSAAITATVKGAQGDVSYSWSVDGTPIDLAGNVYAVDSEEVGGPYEVKCEASDGVSEPVSASVSYSVVEAPVVSGDQLTRETTGVTGNSYTEWTATGESGTKYAGQSAGGNESIQLRTTSPAGIVITESTGKDVASVTVEWNDATADKRSIEIYGSTSAYAGPADLYGDAKGELLGEIAKGETSFEVAAGYPYIGILAKGGALYLSSVTIGFAGEAGLSVSLDKANGFTIDLGTADSITASAKNGTEPYSYVWTSDTPDLNGTGETLAIPATLAEGDYTVQVEVTDADSNKASKQIGFTVAAPLVPHAINIAVGIPNGTVTSDPEVEAVKGTQVKLTATATAEGYALKEMTVTYGETVLTFTSSPATFEMPDEAVSVGATFAEVKDYATLPFIAEDTPYTGPWQKATIDGLTSKGLGTDYVSGGVPVAAKFDTTGDWMQIKFDGTPGELSYAIKGNSINAASNSTFLVQESTDGETWTTLATYQSEDETLTITQTGATNELSASSRFVRFFYEEKGAGNVGIYDVYISSGGPATFSIKLDPASYFEVEVGQEASIAATPKNAEGEVHYKWTVGGEPAGSDSEVLGLDTTAATDELEVVCTATDGADTVATAKVSYKVVPPAQKYTVTVADGILNGTVELKVDGEIVASPAELAEGTKVTVVATPVSGYKLDKILLDGAELAENPFTVTGHALVSAVFVEKPVVAGFTKISSLDELTEGEYVLVGSDTNGTYGAVAELTGSTKVLSAAAVTIEDDVVVDAEESQIWTFAQVEGGWTIYNEAIGFLGYSGSQNSAMAESEASDKSTWTFSMAEDLFKVANVGTEGRTLRYNYNKGNMRFACYTSDSLPNIGLYKGSSGPAPFTVTFDKKDGFEVPFGTADSITATAKNGSGDYSYAWTGDLTGKGATLEIPATLEAKSYTVTVTATDNGADGVSVEKSISFTVAGPVVKYPITVERVSGGVLSVEGDKTEAEAGEKVKVTATADGGKRLSEITVTGETTSLSFKSSPAEFEMPAEAVTISATFEDRPVSAPFKKIKSLAELEEGEYVITGAKAEGEEYAMKASISTGSTKYIERRDDAVTLEEDTVTDAEDSIIWTLAKGDKGWTIYNEAVGYAGYVASGNSAGAEAEASEKSSWTIAASETEGLFLLTNVGNEGRYLLYNSGSPRFACYEKTSSGKQLALYKGESGPAKFSVTLDPASYFEVNVGATGVAITATPKNAAEGAVKYAWSIGGTPVDATGAVLTLDTSKATEVLEVVCTATDADGATATAKVSYKVVAAPAQPVVTCNLGESVTGKVGDEFEFVFTAANFTVVPDGWWVTVNGGEEEAMPASDDNQSATFSWAPEADGKYTIVAMAFDENDHDYTCTVTATIGAGGPEIGGEGSDVELAGFNAKKFSGKVSDEMAAKYKGARLDYATKLVNKEWNWSEDKVVPNAAEWPNLDFDYQGLGLKYAVFRLVFIE